MKLRVEVADDYYAWLKNSICKSTSDFIILDGIPYEERPQGGDTSYGLGYSQGYIDGSTGADYDEREYD